MMSHTVTSPGRVEEVHEVGHAVAVADEEDLEIGPLEEEEVFYDFFKVKLNVCHIHQIN